MHEDIPRHPSPLQDHTVKTQVGPSHQKWDFCITFGVKVMQKSHFWCDGPTCVFTVQHPQRCGPGYGLAYLHSIPIIHRDLNAGHVLLTESLRAKIADLGVAKLFDRETAMIHTRTLCPRAQDFMPPECLDESPKYNTKVDIFSFGHLTIYLANQKAPVVTDRSVTSCS